MGMVHAMAAATGGYLELTLMKTEALAEVRQTLAEWLQPLADSPEVVSDVISASTELCTNALRAAESKAVMRVRAEGNSVLVEVLDDGSGITAEIPDSPPPPFSESGRGLFLVRQLVDVLWIRHNPEGGTRAAFARRLTA